MLDGFLPLLNIWCGVSRPRMTGEGSLVGIAGWLLGWTPFFYWSLSVLESIFCARCWYSLKNEKRKDTRAPFGTYNDCRTGDVQTSWVYFTPGKCTRAGKKRILEEMSNAARVPLDQNRFQVWGVALARSKMHWIMSWIWMKTYSVLMKLDKTRMVQTHGGLCGPF